MRIPGLNIQISRAPGKHAAAESSSESSASSSAAAGADLAGISGKSLSVSPAEWLAGEDFGLPLLSNAYEQSVWVYRAINALAEQVANVPFVFSEGERGRENLITSGPLHDFYARPHPHLNRFQYWELRVIWLMLRGECFRIPIFTDSSGAPASAPLQAAQQQPGAAAAAGAAKRRLAGVVILDPAHFQHIVEDHQLIGWRYTGFGAGTPLAGQVFLPEEVWFERLPNPFHFWRGLSPLQVAAMATSTDYAASAFMRGIIENNGDTGLIVRTDKWLTPEQRQQIFAAISDRKRRAGLADRPVLVTGTAEIIKPQLSSTDLQFLENRKFSRAEICAAFGVPEEIVTTTDHAKYDVMAGARLNFIEHRVAPLCARLEAAEEVTVKALDPRASGWFDLDSLPIMQEARRSRLAAARTGFEMGIPFNELNRVLDLGFKPLPWGDRGFIPANLRELGLPTRRTGVPPVPNQEPEPCAAPASPRRTGVPPVPNQEPESCAAAVASRRTGVPPVPSILPSPNSQTGVLSASARQTIPASSHTTTNLVDRQDAYPTGVEDRRDAYPTAAEDRRDAYPTAFVDRQDACPTGVGDRRDACPTQMARKLRRFIFEQRGRVLGAVAACPDLNAVSATSLIDVDSEDQKLLALLNQCGAQPGWIEAARETLRISIAALQAELAAALDAGDDTRDQLLARVKAFYNGRTNNNRSRTVKHPSTQL